jgi:LDH2 family malate/lactate/ureidoglycolate dehydrogenase
MTLDRNGPRSTVGLGAIHAFGEHKGSGFALTCEFVGGWLTSLGRRRASADYGVCVSVGIGGRIDNRSYATSEKLKSA